MERTTRSPIIGYVIGFGLSILLTLAAYVLVVNHVLQTGLTVAVIVLLAAMQLFVQLWFFLHLGDESRPRLRLVALLFALGVLVIIVFGSLWIMSNLNYNMMQRSDMKDYLHQNEGL